MKSFNEYKSYKDSGINWLGQIPEHWEVKKIKRLCLVKRGASPRPIEDPIYFDDDGEYSWVRISDVTASERYLTQTEQKLSELGKSKSVPLEPGESKTGPLGGARGLDARQAHGRVRLHVRRPRRRDARL